MLEVFSAERSVRVELINLPKSNIPLPEAFGNFLAEYKKEPES